MQASKAPRRVVRLSWRRARARWGSVGASCALLVILGVFAVASCSVKERNIEIVDGGGAPGSGGTLGEGGASGGASGTGGATQEPGPCDDHDDCGASAPVCDEAVGECRSCESQAECEAKGLSYCLDSGRCAACQEDDECQEETRPFCGDDKMCRGCLEHRECESLACGPDGACVDPARVVYALAATGSTSASCGTRELPCLHPSTAVTKVNTERPYLVFVPTAATFSVSSMLLLPEEVTVLGHGVEYRTTDGVGFRAGGGSVRLEDVFITGATAASSSAVYCDNTELAITRGKFVGNIRAVEGRNCHITVEESTFSEQTSVAIYTQLGSSAATGSLTVERSLFEANATVVESRVTTTLLRNNLFVGNGTTEGYRRIFLLSSEENLVAFNTFYGNFNACDFVNLINCSTPTSASHVFSSNIVWNSFPGSGCVDQLYSLDCTTSGGSISDSIAEIPWPGSRNSADDPLFSDPDGGDFSLGVGSSARDAGNSEYATEVDYFGRPRSVGRGPDMGAIEAQ